MTRANRVDGRSDLWEITVEPDSGFSVTVALPETSDCDAQGAVRTSDGRMLSASVKLIVTGPDTPEPILEPVQNPAALAPFRPGRPWAPTWPASSSHCSPMRLPPCC